MAFLSETSDNAYLLKTLYLTTVFYYLIPALFNATLIIYLIRTPKKYPLSTRTIFICIAVFYGIFSIEFSAGIPLCYAGLSLIYYGINKLRSKTLKTSFKKDFKTELWLYFYIIILYIIYLPLTLTGGRASTSAWDKANFLPNILETTHTFIYWFSKTNRLLIILGLIVLLTIIWNSCKNKNYQIILRILKIGIFFGIISIYIILISAYTKVNHINRPDIFINAAIPFFGALIYGIIALAEKYKFIKLITLPFTIIFILLLLEFAPSSLVSNAQYGKSANENATITKSIIQQLVDADSLGKSAVEIHLPKYNTNDNWPLASYATPWSISTALYNANVLSKPIELVPVLEEN